MRIQIDTNKQTVKVLDDVNLGELIIALEKLLGGEYKKYTLESHIDYFYYYWGEPYYKVNPYEPWPNPIITCGTGTYSVDITSDSSANKN